MLKNRLFFLVFFTLNLYADNFGSLYFHGNCVTCHDKSKDISAPSILKIQKHYKRAFPQRDDFIHYLSKWVNKPSKEESIMLDSIQKYNLMPDLAFEINVLKEIAGYIYDTDFNTNK